MTRTVHARQGFRARVLAIAGLNAALLCGHAPASVEAPPADTVRAAISRAVRFFDAQVSRHGGYVYRVSGDLRLSEGEGITGPDTIWVQPPGTPAVGQAMLDAYRATGDPAILEAAHKAGTALVLGQLHSGGWDYAVQFEPDARAATWYRRGLDGSPQIDPTPAQARQEPAGWDTWRQRKYAANKSVLDDDTTQSATRFLLALDATLQGGDPMIHDAADHALRALTRAQYPNGAWSANFDRLADQNPRARDYPPARASYPESWPAAWPKDFRGCYVLNDGLMARMIETFLAAWKATGDEAHLRTAQRAGLFLLSAQLPGPQPAWAQQYDRAMQPVWDRAFEPPAITSRESQDVMLALLDLAQATGDVQYLAPLPEAILYLRQSLLSDGRLSRFYELRTNRPVYFTRDSDGRHVMTYEQERLASNYGFLIDSRLDEIEARYQRLLADRPEAADPGKPAGGELTAAVERVLKAQDDRGAWVTRGRLEHHRLEPAEGIIDSQVFIDHLTLLCRYLGTIEAGAPGPGIAP